MNTKLSPPLAEGFGWIESFTNFEKRPGSSLRPFRLDRMKSLADACGNPQKQYKIIHIAGSKGKGSTAAFIGSILSEAGFDCGIYTSPHVDSYRERFLLNRGWLPEQFLIEAIQIIRETFKDGWFDDGSEPTTFELLTLSAFVGFQLAGCTWVVLETGLGGRLDATNIVLPELAVITSIELEHTRILGNTLEEVAAEKGGIIKPDRPILLGRIDSPAYEVLLDIAARRKAEVSEYADASLLSDSSRSFTAKLPGGKQLHPYPGMIGRHQVHNALLAAMAADMVIPGIEPSVIERGLSLASLPGRFERCRHGEHDIVFDAAHTPTSIKASFTTFRDLYPAGGVVILGLAEDKDVQRIRDIFPGDLTAVIVSKPGSFRESNPENVAAVFRERFPDTELIINSIEALDRALALCDTEEPILVIGSFYLLGDLRSKGEFS